MPRTFNSYSVTDEKGQTVGEVKVDNRVNRIIASFKVAGETVASIDMDRVFRGLTVYYISEVKGYDHDMLARKLTLACVTENPDILVGVNEVFVREEIEYWSIPRKLTFAGLDEKPYPNCVRLKRVDDDLCHMHVPVMEVIGEVENVKRAKVM
jgi:hypothetical protein